MSEREERLIAGLVACVAADKLDFRSALPALQSLIRSAGTGVSFDDILDGLSEYGSEVFSQISKELKASRIRDADQDHQQRVSGAPRTVASSLTLADVPTDALTVWHTPARWMDAVQAGIQIARDLRYVSARRDELPVTTERLRHSYDETSAQIRPALDAIAGDILDAFENQLRESETDAPAISALESLREKAVTAGRDTDGGGHLDELQRKYASATTVAERRACLDQLCCHPNVEAAAAIRDKVVPEDRDRAAVILTCRFGRRGAPGWDGWANWLTRCERRGREDFFELRAMISKHPAELLLMWLRQQPNADAALIEQIECWCGDHAEAVDPDALAERRQKIIPANEWNALVGVPLEVVERRVETTPSAVEENTPAPSESPPVPPAGPSLWNEHLQPFLVEQWYLVAGIVMVLAGSSLLAYYTWDKHWLVRYSLMPLLLGGFTGTLAWLGGWIERRDDLFATTAAILRGAAIGLLPVNFMAVAVLSNDTQVAQKTIAVPVMGLIYLLVFGYGLRKWCKEVHPQLGWPLGGTLLLLNSLVMLGPLAQTAALMAGNVLRLVIGVGFYLGFAAAAGAVVWFCRRVLSREMAEQQRIPWFFGGTLIVTFLQVFVWVHGYLRHIPQVSTYSAMVILLGWLVLLVERRTLQFHEQPHQYRGESFVGFALVLLGVMMGMTQPFVRVLAFVLAGLVWLNQSRWRREPLHDWIGLTFLSLGGASIGLLEQFPSLYRPALGLGLAVALGISGRLVGRSGRDQLRQACIGMQAAVLMLTTVVAVLAQWYDHSPPLVTGGYLLLVAASFAYRAWQDNRLRWVHSAMTVVAIALPYLGCVQIEARTLQGNVLPFGLAVVSLLWLALNAMIPLPRDESGESSPATRWRLIRETRSTVLWVYGSLAVAAMVLRVVVETDAGGVTWLHMAMDYSGPLMMALALAFATWYSRSLIPAAMAAVIVIILFPEIRATFAEEFEALGWGTGLGGAASGLALLLICFVLRPARFLRDLGDGDRFMGRIVFPVRRYDHTLFTWPLLGSALFLTIRTNTVTFVTQLMSGLEIRTAIALGLTSVSWMLLAVYLRRHRYAELGTYVGCLWLFLAIWFGFDRLAPQVLWIWPVLWSGLAIQALYLVFRYAFSPRLAEATPAEGDSAWLDADWTDRILIAPTRRVLHAGSIGLSLLCIAHLFNGMPVEDLVPLVAFLAAQIVWHGTTAPPPLHGSLLFVLTWIVLLAWTAQGRGPLLERLSFDVSLFPTLCLLFAVQSGFILMEAWERVHVRLRNITDPCLFLSTLLATGLLGWGAFEFLSGATPEAPQGIALSWNLAAIVVLGLLTARAQSSLVLVLLSLLLGYALAQADLLDRLGDGSLSERLRRLTTLGSPWRLGVLAVALAAAEFGGRRVYGRFPRLLAGPYSQRFFRTQDPRWLIVPALGVAVLTTLLQTVSPEHRNDVHQLGASFLAATAWAICGWSRSSVSQFIGSGVLFTIGNIHSVRHFAGDVLRPYGISEIQLICLGMAATLIELTAVRLLVRRDVITRSFNEASLGLAGLVLALLAVNYFAQTDLSAITPAQFVVSGAMAYLAGLYFRRAARRPMSGEEPYVQIAEGMYHFGVTVAFWCALLLIPPLRTPALALFALGLPIAYFYVRAETGIRAGSPFGRSYRNSATALGFAVLFAYVFRFAVQMVLFPPDELIPAGAPLTEILHADFYHSSAPFVLVLSIVLLRLHGLGGTAWLAVYGGLALVAGSYFTVSWAPGLSPFHHPVAGAWCAVGMAHFWTLVSNQRSPLRTAIQRLAAIDEQQWFGLRRIWGVVVLAATHVAVVWGLCDWQTQPLAVAPLLVGAASVLIHQGAIRRSPLYFGAAAAELLVALHADFLVESYLDRHDIVWVILGIWVVLLVAERILATIGRTDVVAKLGIVAAGLSFLMFVHVLYHRPWTPLGLWMFGLGSLLAALTPRTSRRARTDEERFAAALLCAVAPWLAYFSQADIAAEGLLAAFRSWPLLVTTSVLLLTGIFARVFQVRLLTEYDRLERSQPRLFDQTLSWFGTGGAAINSAAIWFSFFAVGAVQVVHHGRPFGHAELGLTLCLYAVLAVEWYFEGRLRRNMASYFLLQLSVLGFFAVIRRQLILTTDFWIPQYDVWASLVVSAGLTGTKQYFDLQPRQIRIPLLGTLLCLPVVALVWTLWNDLGSDVAMLVVGLQSLMFVFMGKDDRESPYNLVAVAGFVTFTLMLFWTRLDLRVIHAYTVPVGLGVLALLQLFRRRIDPATRNRVRLVTLLTMIGSVGYYALLDTRYPITFHLTMILICLASMGFGSFFRIRLYVILGFAGLLTDVGSIVYRFIAGVEERSTKMTIIGSLVLVVGACLVFGAIYYKANKERIDARIADWRRIFGDWE